MIRRLAGPLLAIAALRWPDELRGEMLAEWTAEVHALAAAGRHARALTFAVSLAASRPRIRAFSVASAARGLWSGIRLLVVLPALAVLGGLLAYCVLNFMPFAVAIAVAMAVLGGLYVPRRVPVALLIPAVTLPSATLYAAIHPLLNSGSRLLPDRHLIQVAVYCYCLMLALTVTALCVRNGRQRTGWIVGILGALAAVDAATIVRYWGVLDPAGAPLWMVAALTNHTFGLPYPTAAEIWDINDDWSADPAMFLVLAGFALGSVIASRVHAAPRTAR